MSPKSSTPPESPIAAVSRVFLRETGAAPSHALAMMLIDAVRASSLPPPGTTVRALTRILQSLDPDPSIDAWATRSAREIARILLRRSDVRRAIPRSGDDDHLWDLLEGTIAGILIRVCRGQDLESPEASAPGTALAPRAGSPGEISGRPGRAQRWREEPPTAAEVSGCSWWWNRPTDGLPRILQLDVDPGSGKIFDVGEAELGACPVPLDPADWPGSWAPCVTPDELGELDDRLTGAESEMADLRRRATDLERRVGTLLAR